MCLGRKALSDNWTRTLIRVHPECGWGGPMWSISKSVNCRELWPSSVDTVCIEPASSIYASLRLWVPSLVVCPTEDLKLARKAEKPAEYIRDIIDERQKLLDRYQSFVRLQKEAADMEVRNWPNEWAPPFHAHSRHLSILHRHWGIREVSQTLHIWKKLLFASSGNFISVVHPYMERTKAFRISIRSRLHKAVHRRIPSAAVHLKKNKFTDSDPSSGYGPATCCSYRSYRRRTCSSRRGWGCSSCSGCSYRRGSCCSRCWTGFSSCSTSSCWRSLRLGGRAVWRLLRRHPEKSWSIATNIGKKFFSQRAATLEPCEHTFHRTCIIRCLEV